MDLNETVHLKESELCIQTCTAVYKDGVVVKTPAFRTTCTPIDLRSNQARAFSPCVSHYVFLYPLSCSHNKRKMLTDGGHSTLFIQKTHRVTPQNKVLLMCNWHIV